MNAKLIIEQQQLEEQKAAGNLLCNVFHVIMMEQHTAGLIFILHTYSRDMSVIDLRLLAGAVGVAVGCNSGG